MTVKRRMITTADKLTVKSQSKNKRASSTGGDLFSKRHRDLDLERSSNSQKMSKMKMKYKTTYSNKMMMILATIMLLAFQSVSSAHVKDSLLTLRQKLRAVAENIVKFEEPTGWRNEVIKRWAYSPKKITQANIRKLKKKKGLKVKFGGKLTRKTKLDAAFITKNILAIQGPGTGNGMSRARNHIDHVKKLLEKTLNDAGTQCSGNGTKNRAMIVNTRTERPYYNSTQNVDHKAQGKDEKIFPRERFPIKRFAFDDHKTPLMEDFDRWLNEIGKFMGDAEANNVLAVHCNAGKARTGTMIVALMLRHILHPVNDQFLSELLTHTAELSKKKDKKKNKGKKKGKGQERGASIQAELPLTENAEQRQPPIDKNAFLRWRDSREGYVERMVSIGQPDKEEYLNFLVSQVLLYYADRRTHNLCAVRRSAQRRYVWWSLKWFLMSEKTRNERRAVTYKISKVVVDRRFSEKINIHGDNVQPFKAASSVVQVFKKGFTQAYDEHVATSNISKDYVHEFEELSEDEKVTGDPKAMKSDEKKMRKKYGDNTVRGLSTEFEMKFDDNKPANIKGDFMIRIGDGRMDFHYNTFFLDPSQRTHKITLSSSQLNGEKKPCVGASPDLRFQNLKVEITFEKVTELLEEDKAAFEAWLQQAYSWKQLGLFDDGTVGEVFRLQACVPQKRTRRRRLSSASRPVTTHHGRYHSRRRLGQKESLMERMARLEANGGR